MDRISHSITLPSASKMRTRPFQKHLTKFDRFRVCLLVGWLVGWLVLTYWGRGGVILWGVGGEGGEGIFAVTRSTQLIN